MMVPVPLEDMGNPPLCAFCGEREAAFRVHEAGARLTPSCEECNADYIEELAAESARRRDLELGGSVTEADDIEF
jgi:hypothetical protein